MTRSAVDPGVAMAADPRRRAVVRLALSVPALGLLFSGRAAGAADPNLREQWLEARWPADLVRAGDRYIALVSPVEPNTHEQIAVARHTRRLLERADIRLYKADFTGDVGGDAARADVRAAALGDKDAAYRMAHRCKDGGDGTVANPQRYIGWLQYAAALGHAAGSYELALHYRRENQPSMAAPYEMRAEELGFKPPPTLDNVRK